MKKIIVLGLVVLFLVSLVSGILPYPSDSFGNNQYYHVVFDEEREASVAARIDLTNTGKSDLSFFTVEIPGSIRMVNAVVGYREKEKRCIFWEKDECVQWEEYYGYRETYYTLDYKSEIIGDNVRYVFNLPRNVREQESVKILLYYKVMGYVKKNLGVYNFKFSTIREDYDLERIRVAVDVVDDLLLEGGKAKTNYNYNYFEGFKGAGVESAELRGFSDSIMWIDGYVKETSGLDPWENFSVNGRYSNSWVLLKIKKILGSLLVVGILFLVLSFIVSKMKVKKIVWKVVLSSFGSALGMVFVWYFMFYFMNNVGSFVGWQFQQFFMMLMLMVVGLIMVILLFGPGLYFGIRYRNAGLGVWCFISTIIWLVVFSIVFILLFGGLRDNVITPMYKGVLETVSVSKEIG